MVHITRQIVYLTLLGLYQVFVIVLFGVFVRYDTTTSKFVDPYTAFQDVNVIVFFGLGYSMCFLKRYGYSAIGFSFLLAGLCVQWGILCMGISQMKNWKMEIGYYSLVGAEVAAAAVLVSSGALLGRASWFQLGLMSFLEVPIVGFLIWLGRDILRAMDAGNGIALHTFGAFFGVGVSIGLSQVQRKLNKWPIDEYNGLEEPSYRSDMMALMGTLFIWIYFPSLNAATLIGNIQQRAVVNTFFSLAGSCVTTFILTGILTPKRKFTIYHVQRATLAGGVAVASSCSTIMQPFSAIIIGVGAAVISMMGLHFVSPILREKLRILDTCDILNVHGTVGVYGGVINVLLTLLAKKKNYGKEFKAIYGGMFATRKSKARSIAIQCLFQLGYLAIGVVLALIAGLVVGVILSITTYHQETREDQYSDELYWVINVPMDPDQRKKIKRITATCE